MPRSLVVRLAVVVLVLVVALVALSRLNPTKTLAHVEKPVPDNVLVH